MEVMIPSSMDIDFHSIRRSPPPSIAISAPSSPKHLGDQLYFNSLSAPTSPSRISEFYREYEEFCRVREEEEVDDVDKSSSSVVVGVPFDWEEKPGTPKSPKSDQGSDHEFAFDFCKEMEKASRSAEELFDGGKIKPLKPPPRLQDVNQLSSPKSSSSPKIGKRIIQNAFSPKQRKPSDQERGRGRAQTALPSSGSDRRASRSLSPLRVSEFSWLEEQEKANQLGSNSNSKSALATISSSSSSSSSSSIFGRWKFKDLLLFRSASEGRASAKDPLNKYAGLLRKQEETKHSSFRSTDSFGSGSGSSKRRSQVSAHELHYTKNKAASEDMKKKTYLPYKRGIMGLAFGAVAHHGLGSPFSKNY